MAIQLTGDGLEASVYPRTYGVSLGWKLLLVSFGFLFALGGIAGLLFLLAPVLHRGNEPLGVALFLSAIALGFAGLGVYTALSALTYRVVLTADGVEVTEPFRRRQLPYREIRGCRTLRNRQGPATLVLVPKDGTAKKLKISLILKRDRAFDAWLAQLADLDREDLGRSEQEVARALYQDRMPEERDALIKRLKLLAKWINGATIAVGIAGFVVPDYRHLLTASLIALPWVVVGLVARFQPLYRFGARRNDAHPDLTAALIVPGLLLTARTLTDAHTFDWSGPMLLACGGGLALGCAALRADPWFRQQRLTAILMCLFMFTYGFGAGLEIDVLADATQPSIYATQVLGKRVSRGSKSSTYYLRVAPWGPITSAEEISVSAARYRITRSGDTVCIYVGKGALRIPWYQVRDCNPM